MSGFDLAVCNIAGGVLHCVDGVTSTFYVCNGQAFLQIKTGNVPSTCAGPTMRAILI